MEKVVAHKLLSAAKAQVLGRRKLECSIMRCTSVLPWKGYRVEPIDDEVAGEKADIFVTCAGPGPRGNTESQHVIQPKRPYRTKDTSLRRSPPWKKRYEKRFR